MVSTRRYVQPYEDDTAVDEDHEQTETEAEQSPETQTRSARETTTSRSNEDVTTEVAPEVAAMAATLQQLTDTIARMQATLRPTRSERSERSPRNSRNIRSTRGSRSARISRGTRSSHYTRQRTRNPPDEPSDDGSSSSEDDDGHDHHHDHDDESSSSSDPDYNESSPSDSSREDSGSSDDNEVSVATWIETVELALQGAKESGRGEWGDKALYFILGNKLIESAATWWVNMVWIDACIGNNELGLRQPPKPKTLDEAVDKATDIDDPMDNVARGMTNIGQPWATAPSRYLIPMDGTVGPTSVIPGISGTGLPAGLANGVAEGDGELLALFNNPQGVNQQFNNDGIGKRTTPVQMSVNGSRG
ncbi:unnamed protein product [Phytophthora fragariaefolia]|uniref:Unnamed protein product n=1 Tax=Phytophthora fragariaefolia TaxID=1490495 RepID=A0A9W7D5K7_9STRA|nr:unnamed protein product [Phytophthora fragariaefolia]